MTCVPKQNKKKQTIKQLILFGVLTLMFLSLPSIGRAEDKPFAPLNPIDNINVKIPGLDKLSQQYPASCTTTGISTNCTLPYLAIYIEAIVGYSMGIAGILAAISIMIGGVIYMTSSGNATRIAKAKSWMEGSVVGLVIALSSYVLMYEVNPDLVGLKSISLAIIEKQEDGTDPVAATVSTDESGWTFPSDPHIKDETGGQKMTTDMAAKLIAATKCMSDSGYTVRVTAASRTPEQQKSTYSKNCGGATSCVDSSKCSILTCCPFKPGAVCPHTSGQAVDVWGVDPATGGKSIAAQYKLQDCMEQAGFCLLAKECWHFEYPQLSTNCGGGHNLNGGNCISLKNQQ